MECGRRHLRSSHTIVGSTRVICSHRPLFPPPSSSLSCPIPATGTHTHTHTQARACTAMVHYMHAYGGCFTCLTPACAAMVHHT